MTIAQICIYSIEFNQEFYIGKTSNINRRFKDHLTSLINNTCANYKMQNLFNKGITPILHIIQVCKISELSTLETLWINEFDTFNNGLNLSNGGDGGGSGYQHNRAIHNKETLLQALRYLSSTPILTYATISNVTGISISSLTNIVNGSAHTWLKEEDIDAYSFISMPSTIQLRNKESAKEKGLKIKKHKLENTTYKKVISPEGMSYTIDNAKQFAILHDLCPAGLSRLLNNKINSHRGWKVINE